MMNKLYNIPKLGIASVVAAAFCLNLGGCDSKSFEKDPLCQTCIESGCTGSAEAQNALVKHFLTLSNAASTKDAAQLLSRVEAFEGCAQKLDQDRVQSIYNEYYAAFFDTAQPFASDRALHAVEFIKNQQPGSVQATNYLVHYKNELANHSIIKDAIDSNLVPLASENDDVFRFLVGFLDDITALAAMDETEARNAALAPRVLELPDEVRTRILKKYLFAEWHMQSSGSTMLPQLLEFDWRFLPLPTGTPQLFASASVSSITIKNEEAKKRGIYARDLLKDSEMSEPDRHHVRVDLGPWLKSADSYRVAAHATVSLWAKSEAERGEEDAPLVSIPVNLDFSYRAYVGVETGAPKRYKNADDNAPTTKSMKLSVCNERECAVLWDGKATTKSTRPKLTVEQGHDFYLLAEVNGAKLPVSGRLMARSMAGATWQEAATFFSNAPSLYAPKVRANIDISSICRDLGTCSLELQLRPSLRMARRDPSIKRYWGDQLELGTLVVDIQNRTASQVYKSF